MAVAEALRPTHRAEMPRRAMPLSFVPESEKRFVSPELTGVAGHELNHALVALSHGAPIMSISVIPSGNSLGRTVIGGLVSNEVMKLIAAGGGCDTHEGSASGFGSDKYKVDVMHHFHGGHSWETARSQASGIVSMYSREVRRKAAEIIAYLGRVSGSMIGEVMLRAQLEVNGEKGGKSEPIIQIFNPQPKLDNYTVIDNLPGNISKITYVIVGKKDEEKYLCGICHGINSHAEKCANAKTKEDLFPRKGIIFPTSNLFGAEVAADSGKFTEQIII